MQVIDLIENYSMCPIDDLECDSYLVLDNEYEIGQKMKKSPINEFTSVLQATTELRPNQSTSECYENLQSFINVTIGTNLIKKKKYFPLKEHSPIRVGESLSESYNKWIKEGKPKELSFSPVESMQIAKVFVTEETSLEILLMLADEGPKTIEILCNVIPPKKKTIKVLFDLWEFELISLIDSKVNITSPGSKLVSKLRNKSQYT